MNNRFRPLAGFKVNQWEFDDFLMSQIEQYGFRPLAGFKVNQSLKKQKEQQLTVPVSVPSRGSRLINSRSS